MASATATAAPARVAALWRYPLKSMRGEELNSALVTQRGLLGDRAYALIDEAEGTVASAKNPRKWPSMFDCAAAFVEPPEESKPLPLIRITLPDGEMVRSDQADAAARISEALGRRVRLVDSPLPAPRIEMYWADIEGMPNRDAVTTEAIPAGTFFDAAVVHLLTMATLDRLRARAPQSRFEVRRFRPNIVLAMEDGSEGFVENQWVGRTLSIGPEVRLSVTGPCPRCVMTTLAQSELPRDPGVLRQIVEQNDGAVGVYASVLRGGRIRRGDTLVVE
jgi:uncharacterized protein YcbX